MSDNVKMPAGIGNAYTFQVFNTTSFVIVIGMPMVLFFKHLGVSATVLGIVMSLPSLLNTLQLPAAPLVEKVGYRAFVLRGWTARSCVILGMAGAAFLPAAIDKTTRMALMLFLLFLYNASRGFSVCGFLPWLTQLVPEAQRGRYLSGDQMANALATLGTMVATAGLMRGATGTTVFGWLFVAAFVAGMVSLIFLRKIPDVPVPPTVRTGRGPVPWKAMLLHPPFFRLLLYNIVTLAAFAGSGVVYVPMLRDGHGFQDWQFLGMMSLWSAGSALVLWGFGRVADRVGSKPLLGASAIFMSMNFGLWACVAAKVVEPTFWVVVITQVAASIGLAFFTMPNTRLVMAVVPEMGRSHFFALFSVATSLTAGLLPVAWGIGIDSVADWKTTWGPWEWNQFSVCYAGLIAVYLVAQIFRHRLLEPKAMPTDVFLHELLVKTPSRALTRLFVRRPMG